MSTTQSRRSFLQKSVGLAAAGVAAPYFFTAAGAVAEDMPKSKNDRHVIGCIGNGGMGHGDAREAARYGDVVAVCDVNRQHAESAKWDPNISAGKAEIYEDYRKLLDRKDIDVVTISTPDHWHVRIAIAALKAGKDVYCQKPLTLTIDEGKKICKVVKETGRVFQVGTQQRSGDGDFLSAVALCHAGRLGKIRRITCAIGDGPMGGPFKKVAPPEGLNWDMWLGQAPKVDYMTERCDVNFRWWFEYSGGKMTDWGAHHVDIAQWAINMGHSGPLSIEPILGDFPQKLKDGMPTKNDYYSTATKFEIKCVFPGDIELVVCSARRGDPWIGFNDPTNGIFFEGKKGSFFVNRSGWGGNVIDDLAKNPLPAELMKKLRKGKRTNSHMGNFMACVKDRSTPISDVESHHRALTTCHLANIAIRLGRKLNWDAEKEQIVGDDAANAFLSRPQREGYEVEA